MNDNLRDEWTLWVDEHKLCIVLFDILSDHILHNFLSSTTLQQTPQFRIFSISAPPNSARIGPLLAIPR